MDRTVAKTDSNRDSSKDFSNFASTTNDNVLTGARSSRIGVRYQCEDIQLHYDIPSLDLTQNSQHSMQVMAAHKSRRRLSSSSSIDVKLDHDFEIVESVSDLFVLLASEHIKTKDNGNHVTCVAGFRQSSNNCNIVSHEAQKLEAERPLHSDDVTDAHGSKNKQTFSVERDPLSSSSRGDAQRP